MIDDARIDMYEDWWRGCNQQPLLAVYVGDPKFDHGARMRPWMDHSLATYLLIPYCLPFCAQAKSFQPLNDVLDTQEACSRHIGYLGAAFPNQCCDFGAVPMAAAISGYAKFDMSSRSLWFELDEKWSLERIAALPDTAGSPWAEMCDGATQIIARRLEGRAIVSDTAMFGVLDILAALRTTSQLLVDCIDSPELVLAAIRTLERIVAHYWGEMRAKLDPVNHHLYANWMGLLSRTPFATSQSDFSILLSPPLFEELALPTLRREAGQIGRAIYHLDGPEQIKYLDMILSIPNIRAIQWPPFPGRPVLRGDWDDMIRKVIDSGRRLVLSEIPPDPDAIRALFSRFPREAFHLTFWAPDVQSGEKLLKLSLN